MALDLGQCHILPVRYAHTDVPIECGDDGDMEAVSRIMASLPRLFGMLPHIAAGDNQRRKFICLILICFIRATEVFGGGTVMEGRGWFIRPLRLRGRATTAAQ
jgi:hypothetical protein